MAGNAYFQMFLLMVANAACFFFFAFAYDKARWLFIPAALFLSVILVLSLTDQAGAMDFVVFGADDFSLALLLAIHIKNRRSH